MALSYSTGVKNAMFNSTANDGLPLAEIFKNGIIEIYSGTRPTNADAAVGAGTLLGRVTVNGATFTPGSPGAGLNLGTAVDGAIDKASGEVWQFSGITNGTATWFRYKGNAVDAGSASTTLPRIDGTISSFSGDVTLTNTSIVANNIYTFNQCRFAWPA